MMMMVVMRMMVMMGKIMMMMLMMMTMMMTRATMMLMMRSARTDLNIWLKSSPDRRSAYLAIRATSTTFDLIRSPVVFFDPNHGS